MNYDPPIPAKNRQPTSLSSLKSLASYKNSSLQPQESYSSEGFAVEPYQSVENEMKNATVKFVDVDSDVTEIFSPSSCTERMSPSTGTSNDSEIVRLFQQVKVLEERNAEVERIYEAERDKCVSLKEELEQMDRDMKTLRTDFREKEDQLKRAEQGRTMLLSKLGGSEASQGEKASLLTELDLLRQENATLTDAISSGEKQCDCLEQEIGTLRTAAQTAQTELASKIAELASLNKELLNVKDANNVQRADMDRELSRLEGELRKADDQARVMQLDLMERTHAEARLKGELSSADSRCAQLEADNMALRRRLLDTGDDRDREVSQLQNRVMCLETELRNVMSDLSRARSGNASIPSGYPPNPSVYVPSSHSSHSTYYHPPAPPHPDYSVAASGGAYADKYATAGAAPGDVRSSREMDDYERLVRGSTVRPEVRNRSGMEGTSQLTTGGRQNLDPSSLSRYASSSSTGEGERGTRGAVVRQHQHHNQPTSIRGALDKNKERDWEGGPSGYRSTQASGESAGASTARSLASLVGGGGRPPAAVSSVKSVSSKPQSTLSPFATDATASQMDSFDTLEKELTIYMTEKTHLEEELSRLLQRGGKTLKDRTRTNQVDARLEDLGKDIARIRRELATKPS